MNDTQVQGGYREAVKEEQKAENCDGQYVDEGGVLNSLNAESGLITGRKEIDEGED